MHPPCPPAGATRPGGLSAEVFGFAPFYLRLRVGSAVRGLTAFISPRDALAQHFLCFN